MEATTQTQQTPGKWRVHEWKDRISITDGDGWQEILWDSDWRAGYRARETEIERARLICAAVNAVREAFPQAKDENICQALEAGMLKKVFDDHSVISEKLKIAQMERDDALTAYRNLDAERSTYIRRTEDLQADLAACREALEAMRAGFADGSIRFTRKRQSDTDPYHPANVLMCAALARLDA